MNNDILKEASFFIEKMQLSEIDELAAVLMNAFNTNPAYSIIFKNKTKLKDGLLWLFRASILLNNQNEILTYVVKEKSTNKIIGTLTLVPPQGVRNGISVYSKIGLFGFISTFGVKPLIRMMSLDDRNKSSLADSIKASEYHYLSMVVIREECRGLGLGSYAVKCVIEELISSNPTCRIIGLTTQLPENVIFYSKLGFEKIDEGEILFKKDRYYNYCMKYVF